MLTPDADLEKGPPSPPSNKSLDDYYEPVWKQKDVKFKTVTKWFIPVLLISLIGEFVLIILNASYASVKYTFSNMGFVLSPIPLFTHFLFGFIVWWVFYYCFLRFGYWCRRDEDGVLIVNIFDPTVVALAFLPLFLIGGEVILLIMCISLILYFICYLIAQFF